MRGAVAFAGISGPSADLAGNLNSFRIAARDEATAVASGRVSVGGPLSAPKVGARLTIDHGEINLPQRLPPSVVTLQVVEIDSKARQPPERPAASAPPALPAALDITLDMPGRVFVRGRGLDSEWRGRLRIGGTTAAPIIAGSLEPVRGSFDILGKSFRLTRGAIVFDGGAKLDPSLDITAEVAAADITAQVVIGGLASAPTVTLTSTPVLPQDEILSRVLFGRGVGRITAAEGIQLAQAAAALTGGGPDVLGRLRTGLGLDWLRFGSSTAGTGTFNRPAPAGSAAGGSALTAGKYIAEGVSVGVTQGISPPTSKVTVEIQLTPRLTLGTEAGQNSGTGVSLNYNYDY
jgi:translocation and assembly module TamB